MGLGHLLHVIWEDYSEYNVYYSAYDTGSPAQASAPKPTVTVQHAVVAPLPTDTAPLSIPTGEATATRAVAFESTPLSPNSQNGASQALSLILGVAPAVLLVVVVTGVLLIRRMRH